MTLCSMTGFARADGKDDRAAWTWEIRSVNGRGLDSRLRLPLGFEKIEGPSRDLIAKHIKRGNVQATLALARTGAGGGIAVNREVLSRRSTSRPSCPTACRRPGRRRWTGCSRCGA